MAKSSTALSRPAPPAKTAPQSNTDAPTLTLAQLDAANRQHDRILAGLVVLLGFLLASFPVSHADIYTHLHTGRLILAGEFPFGADPYCYTTQGVRWVHNAWLFDVLIYLVYSLAGGAGLVLFRGLAVAGLLLLLFQIRRRDASLFPVVLSLGLAAVVLSPRLFLRPELASYVLVGVTLFLLWRPPAQPRRRTMQRLRGLTGGRVWVFLPPLFALWANLDQWFLLGPAAVGLFLLGEVIQDRQAGYRRRPDGLSGAEQRQLLLVLLIGLAACLLNPFHVHLFRLPTELGARAWEMFRERDPEFRTVGLSPFSPAYFERDQTNQVLRYRELTIAEWLYYPFVLLGLTSFWLNRRQGRWWRFLVWAGFFALSAWQARLVGFFAAAAAPVTALNLQDWWLARRADVPAVTRRQVAYGQLARALLLLGAVALATLMVVHYEVTVVQGARRVPLGLVHPRGALGWSLVEDPSHREAARQLGRWRAEGKLAGHAFNLFPMNNQGAHYWAWFGGDAPAQAFIDTRFHLHGGSADQYLKAAQALRQTGTRSGPESRPIWQAVFREHGISHLVLSRAIVSAVPDPLNPQQPLPLAAVLLQDRDEQGVKQWEQLAYNDGRTFILAWTGSPHWSALQPLRFDPEREAFRQPTEPAPRFGPFRGWRTRGGPLAAGAAMAAADVLTGGPDDPPAAGGLGDYLAGGGRWPSLSQTAAEWYLGEYERAWRRFERDPHIILWSALLELRLLGKPGAGVQPLATWPEFDYPSDAWMVLAVRAARRGVADRPDHFASYFLLFQAYATLERDEQAYLPRGERNPVRSYQVLWALFEATRRQPDAGLHLEMTRAYLARGLNDLAVQHYRDALALLRAAGPLPEVGPRDFEQFIRERAHAYLHQSGLPGLSMDAVERDLEARRVRFHQQAVRLADPLEQAHAALQENLFIEARDALQLALRLTPDPQSPRFREAVSLLTEVLIRLGDFQSAEQMLFSVLPGSPAELLRFHELGALIATVVGDYDRAIEHRHVVDALLRGQALEQARLGLRLHVLGGESEPLGNAQEAIFSLQLGLTLTAQRGNQLFHIGLLALESGRTEQAAAYFRRSVVEIYPEAPFRGLADRYHQLLTGKRLEFGAK